MSNSTVHSKRQGGRSHWKAIGRGLRALAFWIAVMLPLAYLPVLYGAISLPGLESLLALLIVHVVSVIVGHDHSPCENPGEQ